MTNGASCHQAVTSARQKASQARWAARVAAAHQAARATAPSVTQELTMFDADEAGFNLVSGLIMTPQGLIDGTVEVEGGRIVAVRAGRKTAFWRLPKS